MSDQESHDYAPVHSPAAPDAATAAPRIARDSFDQRVPRGYRLKVRLDPDTGRIDSRELIPLEPTLAPIPPAPRGVHPNPASAGVYSSEQYAGWFKRAEALTREPLLRYCEACGKELEDKAGNRLLSFEEEKAATSGAHTVPRPDRRVYCNRVCRDNGRQRRYRRNHSEHKARRADQS